MPRPKILEANEGVGEALFYPYNVLVNKCSGSCNTLESPGVKICLPHVIKGSKYASLQFFDDIKGNS